MDKSVCWSSGFGRAPSPTFAVLDAIANRLHGLQTFAFASSITVDVFGDPPFPFPRGLVPQTPRLGGCRHRRAGRPQPPNRGGGERGRGRELH